MNKKTGIYKITSPSGKIYIGESVDIDQRWSRYRRLGCKQQRKLYNSLKKYGVDAHIFEVVEECELEDLKKRERYWQEYYDVCSEKGLNLLLTSTDELKRTLSKESIEKMKKTFKERKISVGENNNMFGKKHSEETKKKISVKRKGQHAGSKNPMFGRRGADNPNFGRTISEEAKKEISQRQMFGKSYAAKIVLDTQTGVFYESASELAYIFNINKYTLRGKLNGNLKNNTPFIYC